MFLNTFFLLSLKAWPNQSEGIDELSLYWGSQLQSSCRSCLLPCSKRKLRCKLCACIWPATRQRALRRGSVGCYALEGLRLKCRSYFASEITYCNGHGHLYIARDFIACSIISPSLQEKRRYTTRSIPKFRHHQHACTAQYSSHSRTTLQVNSTQP